MTARVFVERSSHEHGFARVFAQEIAPELDRIEHRRRRHLRTFVNRLGISAGLLALVIAVVLMLPASLETTLKVLPTLVIVGVVIAAIWAHGPWKAYGAELRDVLVGPICRFLGGLEYTRKPRWGYGPLRFRELGLVSRYSRAEIEDMFEGAHRGTGFRLVEARLIRGSGRHQTKVFDGLLFEIEVPVGFGGRILILPARGLVRELIAQVTGHWFAGHLKGMTRLRFEPPFGRRFRVHAVDPAQARALISPGFRATLVALAEDHRLPWWHAVLFPFRRRRLAAAFTGGKFLMALPVRGNLFEVGSVLRPAHGCERDIRRFMRDVVTARAVIDYLHGERPARSR